MDAKILLSALKAKGYGPFIHVPCSSLGALIAAAESDPAVDVLNPANEAIALGIASGAYLTGKKAVLLIQNSGFLNILNGLTSLNQIFNIPVLIVISWRGYGKDAPEHEIVGRRMEAYLKTFEIEYSVLEEAKLSEAMDRAEKVITGQSLPYTFLIRPELFGEGKAAVSDSAYVLSRMEAIKIVKEGLRTSDFHFISTNGFISRESYEVAQTNDFYMMGSMGHALPLGLGAAKYSDKKIAVLDGDGAVLMHLGAMASIAAEQPKNILHVVFDNEAYGSTGGQPTLAGQVKLEEIARVCGYKHVYRAADAAGLAAAVKSAAAAEGPNFLLVKVRPGNAKGIKRVSDEMTCPEIRDRFMKGIANGQ